MTSGRLRVVMSVVGVVRRDSRRGQERQVAIRLGLGFGDMDATVVLGRPE